MCESCVKIDRRIDQYRMVSRPSDDPKEIELIEALIAHLYEERVRQHQNPQATEGSKPYET